MQGLLEQTLMILRRHRRLVVLCVVITGIVAILASMIQTERYTSTASLLFREENAPTSIFGSENATPVSTDAIRKAAINVELVRGKVCQRPSFQITDRKLDYRGSLPTSRTSRRRFAGRRSASGWSGRS